jgi:cellulose biosynthesis protein BcsS
MLRAASVALALAMAATLSVRVNAEPAKTRTDGREELHANKQQSVSLFGNLWHHLPLSEIEFRWPPFKLGKAPKLEGGNEERHVEELHFLYFSGSDLWQHWAFGHTGVIWSPAGLSNEGFTLKVVLGSGAYGYVSGALNNTNVIGRQSSLSAMPGWRFKRAGYEVTVYAGFDLQVFTFTPIDPATRLAGRYMGARGGFELWHEPSSTTMLVADASYSSIGAGNSARIAYGWRLFERFYLGPEAQIYSTDSYLHSRVGLHVTALKIDEREWSGAVGLASDNDNRSGVYVRLNVLTRR